MSEGVRLENEEIHPGYFTCFTGGGVYFIQPVDGGPIKIGWSNRNPKQGRLQALQSASPLKLRLVGRIGSASVGLERDLHREFAEHRLHGEWFEPEPVIEWLKANVGGSVTVCDHVWSESDTPQPTNE